MQKSTVSPGDRVFASNRKARHDYHILEVYEAGIELKGTEVKSVRAGKVNLKDSYAAIQNGEVFLHNVHISHYTHGNIHNHDPVRTRKLLLNRTEIKKLYGKVAERGLTLVPLSFYLVRGRIKVEIALVKGKKLYDKREAIAERDRKRDQDREMRSRH